MKRVNVLELEDEKWFQETLRNYGTDFLQEMATRTDMYKPIAPLLIETLKSTGNTQIIDLASGGGGGLVKLSEHLQKEIPEIKINLSDYFPNIPAFEKTVAKSPKIFSYSEKSVDATNVPFEMKGVRTQFLSFHHFSEDLAVKILQNAVDSKSTIAIFEGQERSVPSVLAMIFSPITLWLITPLIKPMTFYRFLFTYIIPVMPMFIMWDGILSSLRTYSVEEMNELVKKVNGHEKYEWNIGKVKSGPGVVLYLVGKEKM
jgi:hypothetical protein